MSSVFGFYSLSLSLFPFHSIPSLRMHPFRDPNSDQGWGGNTTPNQSKSFRILQKITDTIDMLDKEADLYSAGAEAQAPQFARQMDVNEQQLRRMQLNEQDKAFINRNDGKWRRRSNEEIALSFCRAFCLFCDFLTITLSLALYSEITDHMRHF